MNIFLFTIMNSGTRSVKQWYEEKGHKVEYMHPVPSASAIVDRKYHHRVTTVRNPRNIANSWLKGDSPRFKNCSWKGQWEMWRDAILKHGMEEIHIIETMDFPVVGRDKRPILYDPPSNFEHYIQFAVNILNELKIEHPYGDNP